MSRLRGLTLRWSRIGHTRGRLITLSIIAAMPMALMAAVIALQEFRDVAHAAQEHATLIEGQAIAEFQIAVASVRGQLAAEANRPGAATCEGPDDILGTSWVIGMLSLTSGGTTLCESGAVPDERMPRRWRERIESGATTVLDVSVPAGLPVLAIRTRSGDIAAAFMNPDWLPSQAMPEPPGAGEAFWLLDRDRHVIATRGQSAALALPSTEVMDELVAAPQLSLRASSAQNRRYAYAAARLPNGWTLIAAAPADVEYFRAMQGLLARIVELGALLLLGLAAVVFGADVAFGIPLRRLSQAVRRWQTGELFDPGPLSGAPDEVLELARSFQGATAVLREKEEELQRAQERRDLLTLEIHHRVKNNLQVIASLLNLQANRIRIPEARAEFQSARDRVRALATLHRHLYADGELHTINMRSFLKELCGQLFSAMGEREGDRITLAIDAAEVRLSSDQAVPLALIVTEAVSNALHYAFPGGRRGHVDVSLTQEGGRLELQIADDGIGVPAGRAETESGTRDGLGLKLIEGFARQLDAELTVEYRGGTRYDVRLRTALAERSQMEPALDA